MERCKETSKSKPTNYQCELKAGHDGLHEVNFPATDDTSAFALHWGFVDTAGQWTPFNTEK